LLLGTQGGRAVGRYRLLFAITQVLVNQIFVCFIPVIDNLAGMGLILRNGFFELWNTSLPIYAKRRAVL
jgi:hypothetical protein